MAKYRKKEKDRKKDAWGIHGSDYRDYQRVFELSGNTLPDFVKERSKLHQVNGLDLLSSTEMLYSLGIGGIAVGLTDPRTIKQKILDHSKRWIVAGDLLHERKQIWKAIRRQMRLSDIPSFDLITQRGLHGFDVISADPALHFYHLRQMWSVLPVGGMILTEIGVTDSIILEDHKTYDFWNTFEGIYASPTPRRGLQLFKYQGAPDELPINYTPTLKELRQWKLEYYLERQ